ncbi:MAG: hypothetical protein U5L45_07390 [Saprospiraceae bacterium]|nr:hypothetical protein [Saprospiraceae bacterium]
MDRAVFFVKNLKTIHKIYTAGSRARFARARGNVVHFFGKARK